jgi:hypothetical protein
MEPLKLFRTKRRYGENLVVSMVFARTDKDVYHLLNWELGDNPRLEVEEVEIKEGCFLSLTVSDPRNLK